MRTELTKLFSLQSVTCSLTKQTVLTDENKLTRLDAVCRTSLDKSVLTDENKLTRLSVQLVRSSLTDQIVLTEENKLTRLSALSDLLRNMWQTELRDKKKLTRLSMQSVTCSLTDQTVLTDENENRKLTDSYILFLYNHKHLPICAFQYKSTFVQWNYRLHITTEMFRCQDIQERRGLGGVRYLPSAYAYWHKASANSGAK